LEKNFDRFADTPGFPVSGIPPEAVFEEVEKIYEVEELSENGGMLPAEPNHAS
jgi:hypothetical protein